VCERLVSPPPIEERSIVMSVSVCLSLFVFVCPRSYLRNYTSDLYHFFVHVTYGRGLVLLWRRSNTLCTFGFMDDVIFAHKPGLLDVGRPAKAQCTCSLGLGYKLCAVIPVAANGRTGLLFGRLK